MARQLSLEELKASGREAGGCWLWTRKRNRRRGYGVVGNGGKKVYVHRLAWQLANSADIPPGMFVCHSCDTPACFNPAHLFIGTAADNTRDAVQKGRWTTKGRPNLKLRKIDYAEAYRDYAGGGITQAALAARYGVDPSAISNAISRVKRHVS